MLTLGLVMQMLINIGIIFLNIPTIAGLSADIYSRHQKNQANRLMGLILSTIGGIDLVIWIIILIIYYDKFNNSAARYLHNNFYDTLIKMFIIGIIKVIGVATNQIIVQNVSNKGVLIFWITITALDCIASLATYVPLFSLIDWLDYAEWLDLYSDSDSVRRWRLYRMGFEIIIALCLIPKLLTAISAVYIVIKGLFGRSNQEQTTIEMDIMDPQLLNNMI